MKKFGYICAGLAVALAAQTARAQGPSANTGLSIFYDARSTAASIVAPASPYTNGTAAQVVGGKTGTTLIQAQINRGNNGGVGDGSYLYINPRQPVNPLFQPTVNLGFHWIGSKNKAGVVTAVDSSKQTLYKYAFVTQRAAATEVIAALGLDVDIVKGGTAGAGNRLEQVTASANGSLWNGNNLTVTPPGVGESDSFAISTKAVKVPVADGGGGTPVYNAAGGLVPSANLYQIGQINLTAGVWKKNVAFGNIPGEGNGVYTVKDKVNNLLVTRVYPATGPSPEVPDFGHVTTVTGTPGTVGVVYTTGTAPEASSGNGLTIGSTSAQADAVIVIQAKGDYNNNGAIENGDIAGFNAAVGLGLANRIRETWLGELNNAGGVENGDIAFFNALLANAADCTVPANCP
ncbi:MAG: hypothetical protein KF841_01025 [Phycisphaerae bacterium]|nr:hypothetical protein [Phycisphaerae bacterium]